MAGLLRERPASDAPTVRRAIDNRIMAGLTRYRDPVGAIARAVNDYNSRARRLTVKEKLTDLHAIEHLTYDWFSTRHQPDLATDPLAVRLKSLLTAVQHEHEQAIQQSLRDPDADPPVADFDDLPVLDQNRVRRVWADLVAGTGVVRITETQDYRSTRDESAQQRDHAGFRVQVLAAFARLLSAEFGRRLVGEITRHGGGHLVTIRPGLATATDDVPAEELLASAADPGGAQLTEFTTETWFGRLQNGSKAWRRRQGQLDRLYPLTDLDPGQDEATRMAFMHRARPQPIRGGGMTEGFSVMDGLRRRCYRFGGGSSSTITFTSDLRDGSDGPMSRFVDDEGNEILVPVFISLGHELGHALHTLQGAQSGATQTLEPIAGAGLDPAEYSASLEEIVTIRGVENPLREEHGITGRHSHHNVISLACQGIRRGELARAFAQVDLLPRPIGRPIEQMLLRVDARLGARELRAARQLLQEAVRALATAQRRAQEQARAQQVQPPPQTVGWSEWLSGLFAKR